MGDSASNVTVTHDYAPDGNVYTSFSWGGIHPQPLGAAGRQLLREVATAPDPVIRTRIYDGLGAAAARAWDDAPHQDQLHGASVPGYVPVRTRIRAMCAGLP